MLQKKTARTPHTLCARAVPPGSARCALSCAVCAYIPQVGYSFCLLLICLRYVRKRKQSTHGSTAKTMKMKQIVSERTRKSPSPQAGSYAM